MNKDDSKYLQYVSSYNDFSNVVVESAQEKADEEEYKIINNKMEQFKHLNSISAAKKLAKELFGIQHDINFIKAGNAKCTIISKPNLFRIILDSPKELKCYNISTKQEKH